MKIVKKIDEKHFLGEEDGEKVLLVKKDLDLEKLAEAIAEDEDDDEEEDKKPAKKEAKKEETKKPAKKEESEDDDEEEEAEGEEYNWNDLKDMDYDELSELVDDEELEDIDVEDYDEDDDDEVEKLRVAIAKEFDIEVPKKGKKGKK